MYRPKTSFSGFKLGLKNNEAYIGVPDVYFDYAGYVDVNYLGKTKTLHKDQAALTKTFSDKFGRSKTYTLYYYPWEIKPAEPQISLL